MTDFYTYVWTNRVNGKQYVGKGHGRRYLHHLRPSSTSLLSKALVKHGLAAFEVSVTRGLSEVQAFAEERRLISQLHTIAPRGYNISSGGLGACGVRFTAEGRARVSARFKGKPKTEASNNKRADALARYSYGQRAGMFVLRQLGAGYQQLAEWYGCSLQTAHRYGKLLTATVLQA